MVIFNLYTYHNDCEVGFFQFYILPPHLDLFSMAVENSGSIYLSASNKCKHLDRYPLEHGKGGIRLSHVLILLGDFVYFDAFS